jgi:hypothetical protein
VSESKRFDLFASFVDALHGRERLKVTAVEHLRARYVREYANVSHRGFIAITEPARPFVTRE